MTTRALRRTFIWLIAAGALGVTLSRASADMAPYPVPLTPTAPLGSLVYDGSTVDGTIEFAGDAQSFTLSVNAGQTITIDVLPAAGLQATVELRDPSNAVLGSATGAAAGDEALLQTVPTFGAGTYTMTIGGAGGTTGAFKARLTLNAALEEEAHGGPPNDSVVTAQFISGSTLPLGAAATRMAVLGRGCGADYSLGTDYSLLVTTDANFERESNNVLEEAQDIAGPVLGAVGNGAAAPGTADSDWYRFPVNAGDNLVIRTTTPSDGPGQFPNTLDPRVELYDENGNLVASDANSAPDGRNVLLNYSPAASSGEYFVRLVGENGSVGEYLLQLQGATGSPSPNAALLLSAADAEDFYSFDLAAGQFVNLALTLPAGVPGTLQLLDASATVLAAGVADAQNVTQSIRRFLAPVAGTYYALVTLTDSEPPVLSSVPQDVTVPAASTAGATVAFATPTAEDACDGALPVTCEPASGSLFAIGTTTVTCTAMDSQGLEGSATFTVKVTDAAEQIGDLNSYISGLVIPKGTKNSLLVKLAAAEAALASGDTASACDSLKALINQSSALAGKKLSVSEASEIVTEATRIRAVIGCI